MSPTFVFQQRTISLLFKSRLTCCHLYRAKDINSSFHRNLLKSLTVFLQRVYIYIYYSWPTNVWGYIQRLYQWLEGYSSVHFYLKHTFLCLNPSFFYKLQELICILQTLWFVFCLAWLLHQRPIDCVVRWCGSHTWFNAIF